MGSGPKTRFTLLHSSPSVDHLPPEEILSPMRNYEKQVSERFRMHLFVDYAPSSPSAVTVGRIDQQKIESATGLQKSYWQRLTSSSPLDGKRVLVLVCGPEPYVPCPTNHLLLSHDPLQDDISYSRSIRSQLLARSGRRCSEGNRIFIGQRLQAINISYSYYIFYTISQFNALPDQNGVTD